LVKITFGKEISYITLLEMPAHRLLVVLNIDKNPFAQINYGTGKDVSDETIKDVKEPLKINWSNQSFIDIPVTSKVLINIKPR